MPRFTFRRGITWERFCRIIIEFLRNTCNKRDIKNKKPLKKLNPLHFALIRGRNLKFRDLPSEETLLTVDCVRRSKIFSTHATKKTIKNLI